MTIGPLLTKRKPRRARSMKPRILSQTWSRGLTPAGFPVSRGY